jgi:hypothetical protein
MTRRVVLRPWWKVWAGPRSVVVAVDAKPIASTRNACILPSHEAAKEDPSGTHH